MITQHFYVLILQSTVFFFNYQPLPPIAQEGLFRYSMLFQKSKQVTTQQERMLAGEHDHVPEDRSTEKWQLQESTICVQSSDAQHSSKFQELSSLGCLACQVAW